MEHVIKGGEVRYAFYCGACDHQWEVLQTKDARGPARERPDRPDRSRS